MSARELVVLGTASQVPTRERNQHGAVLLWDDQGILLDPGEGTQRQMIRAGVSASRLTCILVTHAHGDHCLGLAGVIQRLSVDRVEHPVDLYYPASAEPYVERLRHAAAFHERAEVREHPTGPGIVAETSSFTLRADHLDHRIETLGYRLEEPDGRRMLPGELDARGIRGPEIGRLKAEGHLEVDGERVTLEEVSEPRRGQVFAIVMDTRLCDAAFELAAGADLLICEATFLESDADLAREYGHLTAAQAARIAAEAGVRRLVLTHYSQRYPDTSAFLEEARVVFDDVVAATDLDRVPVPPRR